MPLFRPNLHILKFSYELSFKFLQKNHYETTICVLLIVHELMLAPLVSIVTGVVTCAASFGGYSLLSKPDVWLKKHTDDMLDDDGLLFRNMNREGNVSFLKRMFRTSREQSDKLTWKEPM